MRERDRLDKGISGYRATEQTLEDALTLIELGEAEGDQESVAEAEKDLQKLLAEVQIAAGLTSHVAELIAEA